MKQFISLFTAFALCTCVMMGQSPLNENDVVGTWKLVIPELDETMEEFNQKGKDKDKEGMDAGDRLEHAVESAVSEFVGDLLGDLEIIFTFEADHDARIRTEIMGEIETESLSWHINSDGGLVIEDDDDDDKPEVWMKKGNKLVQVNKSGKKNDDAYMIRVSD